MKRNAITGEYTFNGEEVNTIALGISDRCKNTLRQYRTAVKYSTGAAEYFANEFKAANKLYKELYGTDYPVSIAAGPVPTADSTSNYTDC